MNPLSNCWGTAWRLVFFALDDVDVDEAGAADAPAEVARDSAWVDDAMRRARGVTIIGPEPVHVSTTLASVSAAEEDEWEGRAKESSIRPEAEKRTMGAGGRGVHDEGGRGPCCIWGCAMLDNAAAGVAAETLREGEEEEAEDEDGTMEEEKEVEVEVEAEAEALVTSAATGAGSTTAAGGW